MKIHLKSQTPFKIDLKSQTLVQNRFKSRTPVQNRFEIPDPRSKSSHIFFIYQNQFSTYFFPFFSHFSPFFSLPFTDPIRTFGRGAEFPFPPCPSMHLRFERSICGGLRQNTPSFLPHPNRESSIISSKPKSVILLFKENLKISPSLFCIFWFQQLAMYDFFSAMLQGKCS